MRTDSLRAEHGVQFKWTVFPLHPETPEAGMELSELFAGRDFDLAAVQDRLAAVAAELRLPLTSRTRTYNSRIAQELGKYAEQRGILEAYQQAVYRAYFVDGRNIGMPEELLEIAEQAGLEKEACRQVLAEGSFAREVDDDWRRARLLGIRGVPAFLCGQRLLVGFRSYQDMEALIRGE